jgi:hypothetical protein
MDGSVASRAFHRGGGPRLIEEDNPLAVIDTPNVALLHTDAPEATKGLDRIGLCDDEPMVRDFRSIINTLG